MGNPMMAISNADKTGRKNEERGPLDAVFACLSSHDRRRILGCLSEHAPASLTRRDLATSLAPPDQEAPRNSETAQQVEQQLADLHHIHLPKLEAAGLIDQKEETVALSDQPVFQDAAIRAHLTAEGHGDAESLDALFGALANSRRRTILDVLSHQFGPIHTVTLAREIGVKESEQAESEVADDVFEEILASLHHSHLPYLSDAEMIEYDVDDQLVEYKGHPELHVPWMHSVLSMDFRSSLTGDTNTDGMGTIHGREQIVSFGQWLCDRADEELFCMFTATDLLEAGCLTRIRDASRERGVTVYLGTKDPDIWEYVRVNAPDVNLWEPKTNWLNLPVAGNRVGRLLVADREAVMLGTLRDDQHNDGRHEEQAIVGEGADNALVVMITQLLRPYLETIDVQPEAIEAQLPF